MMPASERGHDHDQHKGGDAEAVLHDPRHRRRHAVHAKQRLSPPGDGQGEIGRGRRRDDRPPRRPAVREDRAEHHHHDDEVVDPRDGRKQHAEQAGDGDPLHLASLQDQPADHGETGHRDHRGDGDPHRAGRLAGQERPQQHAAQRLVGRAGVGPEPPGGEDRARPVGLRVLRQQQPGAERPGRRHRQRGQCGAAAAGQPQVHDEDPGDQLDRRSQPDKRAARPARRGGRAVGQGQCEQHHVNLAEPDLVPHREQVGTPGEQHGEQHRPHPPGAPQQRRERVAEHDRERHVDDGDPGQLRGRPWDNRKRHREQRRDRRVGEGEQLRRLGQHGVQRLAPQHAQAAGAVYVEVHHPLVGRIGQVAAHQRLDDGQRRDPGEHPEHRDGPRRQRRHAAGQPPSQLTWPCRGAATGPRLRGDPGGGAHAGLAAFVTPVSPPLLR